jgi:hypothetical protein
MKKKTPKIHHYGIWIALCFVLALFLPPLVEAIPALSGKGFIVSRAFSIAIAILFVLSIIQYNKISKNQQVLDVYEKEGNVPLMHNIATCVLIYPILCIGLLAPAGAIAQIAPTVSLFIIVAALGLGWIPGLVLFVKDQKKLWQYRKKHICDESFWARMVEFVVCYLFFNFIVLGAAYSIYDFIQHAK